MAPNDRKEWKSVDFFTFVIFFIPTPLPLYYKHLFHKITKKCTVFDRFPGGKVFPPDRK